MNFNTENYNMRHEMNTENKTDSQQLPEHEIIFNEICDKLSELTQTEVNKVSQAGQRDL